MRFSGALLSAFVPFVIVCVVTLPLSHHLSDRYPWLLPALAITQFTLIFVMCAALAVGSWVALRTPLETHALAAEPDRRDRATLRPLPPVTPRYWFAWGALGVLGALAAVGAIVYFVVELRTLA
ncbi:MAG: hypothetical protein KF684_13015 [Phycisphaeraceae bacterium]|nr:hypothetical protein [Phycisphaeraceae bacterium]